MKQVMTTSSFAVRTARGERRRIRSFLKEIETLGVGMDNLPAVSVRALTEADRFLGRYIDLLAHEVPTPEQLDGVMEGLGGIDRVVRNAMAEILRSLGWKPEEAAPEQAPGAPGRKRRSDLLKSRGGGNIIPFPGPKQRKSEG